MFYFDSKVLLVCGDVIIVLIVVMIELLSHRRQLRIKSTFR